ncbi:MAG TPA: atypical membrane-integrating protein (Mistic protein) [Candidatus Angelobacter sp.]|nr:atypical membrane-integrating protein (Mistic protein) [Candidatus Angelobacter sp.]
MKANHDEGQLFSDSIDLINNGIEAIINLYNDLEPDQPLIQFDQEVLQKVGKLKEKYGDAFVDKKINAVVKEMIDWLPVDDEEKDKGQKATRKKKTEQGDTKLPMPAPNEISQADSPEV